MTQVIKGKTGDWELVMGLEIHAQVASKSKLFSGAAVDYGAEPNQNVSFVDAAMPGMLPVINEYCIEQAIKTGLALNAQINRYSVFDRKNYFYADLPQGYQISQFADPIVGKGKVVVDLPTGESKEIGITRIHLEQDAGKSLHDQNPRYSYIDLNRSGVALMEIVTEPDFRTTDEVVEFMKKLRNILRYIGTCDADLEKGMMRCDANVSVRKAGGEYGTRCEIKNLNSIRNIQRAIEYEAGRQVEILESGGKIDQETRLFNADTGTTATMRSKEDAHDYRYFPDPDLLPLEFTQEYVEKIRATLPELPDAKMERYKVMGLSDYDARVLVAEKETTEFFDEASKGRDAKLVSNWLTVELFGRLNKVGKQITESPVSAKQLGELVGLIQDNTISGKIAKDVFEIMFETSGDATKIIEEKGWKQVTDSGAIEKIVDEVIAANPDKVAEYKGGKDKMFGFFVGQVLKASGGKANPTMVNDLLKKKLS